ncbi:MAG: response regulator transcription factor [Myxococcales bacterium]
MRRRREPGLRIVRFSLGGRRFAALVEELGAGAAPGSVTPAEREVACLLCRGASNQAIAAQRGTSLRTVANQVSSLMRKLGVDSRVQLALRLCPSRSPRRPLTAK